MSEEDINVYKGLQAELQNLQNKRGQFLSQVNENEMVMKELELTEEGKKVYKLIGPVLLAQELDEVKENVGKRIEFIVGEVDKVDKQIVSKQVDQKKVMEKIMADQQSMRARAADEARKVFEEQQAIGHPTS